MHTNNRRLLSEAKKDLELAVVKSLCGAPLRPVELHELLSVDESDLMRDYGCDLYMAETVKQHVKQEQFRLRSQNHNTPHEDLSGLYPDKPYTRTSPLNESFESGRMLDYGHVVSDSREGRMARAFLHNIADDASRLHQLLNDEDDLPQWCEYKIAQAKLMMNTVREYLEYKLNYHGDDVSTGIENFTTDDSEEAFRE